MYIGVWFYHPNMNVYTINFYVFRFKHTMHGQNLFFVKYLCNIESISFSLNLNLAYVGDGTSVNKKNDEGFFKLQ